MTRPPSAARLRRLALRGQGVGGARKLGAGVAGVRKTLERIGYVQIDTISVVARAHHHVLFTRVSRYREDMLNELVRERRAFEYWRHAAAYMPLKDYRFALPMMRNIAGGGLMWFRDPDRKLMARVKDRIREEGPLFARDFEDTRASKEGWWDWKPAKQALEQLFMEGELTSVERQGFQKRYELMERFLPGDVDTSEPGDGEYADHVIDRSLRAHGFATRRTMTWLCRDARLRKAVTGRLPARVGAGELDERRMESGEPVYALPGAFDRHVPAPPDRVRLLSPFDNTVIQRDRCAAVFGFDYTIECYVPEAKRAFRLLRSARPVPRSARGAHGRQGPPRRGALRDQGAVHRAGRTGGVLPRSGDGGVGLRRVHRLHGGGRGPGHPRKVSDPPRTSARRPGAVGGTDFRFHAAPRPTTTLRTRRLAGQPARASKPASDRSGFSAVLQERLPDPIERLVIDSGCEIDTEDPGSRSRLPAPEIGRTSIRAFRRAVSCSRSWRPPCVRHVARHLRTFVHGS